MASLKKNLPAILMILLGIALGILLIIDAERMTALIFRIFGIALVVLAVVMVIRYLVDRKKEEDRVITLVTAVLAFIIGMVLAVGAEMIVTAGTALCAIFYGAVMIVNGVLKISEFISLKKQGIKASAVMPVSAIVSLALGVVVIIFCSQALKVIGLILGVTMIVNAILDIAGLVITHRTNKHNCLYDTSGDDSDYDLE